MEAAEPTVLYDQDGHVVTITYHRPDRLNAINGQLRQELNAAWRRFLEDPDAWVAILTGSGRAFCVGQDLREHAADLRGTDAAAGSTSEVSGLGGTVREHYNPIATLLATMPKPVVAAVNGVAAGAGASFAFACDLRLLAESAGFNLAFAGIGLSCDSGASWWLPRLIGYARAKELLLMPRTVRAEEALQLGLASRVVPDGELAAAAAELAGRLAAGPTQAYAAIRHAVAFSAGHDLPTALEHEAELMSSTGATADHRAAVEAFLAKQPPTFRGS